MVAGDEERHEVWAGLPDDWTDRPPRPGWRRGADGTWVPPTAHVGRPAELPDPPWDATTPPPPPSRTWQAPMALAALAGSGVAQLLGMVAFSLVSLHAIPADQSDSWQAQIVTLLLLLGAPVTFGAIVLVLVDGSAIVGKVRPRWVGPVLALAFVLAVTAMAWPVLTMGVGGSDPYYGGPM